MNKCVSNCSNCPLKANTRGHGENFDYCSHPESPKGYDNIIDRDVAHPNWCPLKKGDYVISLREVKVEPKGYRRYCTDLFLMLQGPSRVYCNYMDMGVFNERFEVSDLPLGIHDFIVMSSEDTLEDFRGKTIEYGDDEHSFRVMITKKLINDKILDEIMGKDRKEDEL